MKRVAIVQRVVPHYRVSFYEQLRRALAELGIELSVFTGQPSVQESTKGDSGSLPWGKEVQNRHWSIGGRQLVWQPFLRSVQSYDLVIVEQASRLLANYPLLAWRRFGGPQVAWWGHGVNLDAKSSSMLGEGIKRRVARCADWWFCYSESTARIVEGLGVPRDRMSVVQNAIDTVEIRRNRSDISEEQIAATQAELGVGAGPIGLYVGSLYDTKRIPYLIEASDQIRTRFPDFQLIVIGDGPDRPFLDDAATTRPWVHVLGVRTGAEMVRYAALCSVILNPGLVGLSVLDGFALGLPMVTCDLPGHGPEIEYLIDGQNGVVLPADTLAADYGGCVAGLLGDVESLKQLSAGALKSAETYTVEEMVNRFTTGILRALG